MPILWYKYYYCRNPVGQSLYGNVYQLLSFEDYQCTISINMVDCFLTLNGCWNSHTLSSVKLETFTWPQKTLLAVWCPKCQNIRLGDLWQCHADIQMLILLQEAYPKLSSAPAQVLMVTPHVCSLTSHGLAQHITYVVMYSLQASWFGS